MKFTFRVTVLLHCILGFLVYEGHLIYSYIDC